MTTKTRLLSVLLGLLIAAVPAALFGWLLTQELVPSGTFQVRHAVGERSPFIDRLLPDARVIRSGTIVDEPVTFFVHPHRSFDEVDVEVAFKNHGAPIVELGASVRGSLALERAIRGAALLDGREYAVPDDVEWLFGPVLGHRVLLAPSYLATVRHAGRDEVLAELWARCLELAPRPAPAPS